MGLYVDAGTIRIQRKIGTNCMFSAVSQNPAQAKVEPQAEAVIELQAVTKKYGSLMVLNGLDLQVNRGEVYGFLGRYGAGKSTAIRLMMGISHLDGGAIRLFGEAVKGAAIKSRQRIGYVAQEQHFYPWMTPRVLGDFVKAFYPHWNQHRYRQLIDGFDLPERRKIGTFSGGMKAKMALTVALATQPELLILDEPTAGMDPVARREFLGLVSEQAIHKGATVFFSTHLIDEIEDVADRICIVEAGKAMYEGPLAPLSDSVATFSMAVADFIPGSTPVEFEGGVRIVHEFAQQGRHAMVLHFQLGVPAQPRLRLGWRQDAMTLEDVFIAIVSKAV